MGLYRRNNPDTVTLSTEAHQLVCDVALTDVITMVCAARVDNPGNIQLRNFCRDIAAAGNVDRAKIIATRILPTAKTNRPLTDLALDVVNRLAVTR